MLDNFKIIESKWKKEINLLRNLCRLRKKLPISQITNKTIPLSTTTRMQKQMLMNRVRVVEWDKVMENLCHLCRRLQQVLWEKRVRFKKIWYGCLGKLWSEVGDKILIFMHHITLFYYCSLYNLLYLVPYFKCLSL